MQIVESTRTYISKTQGPQASPCIRKGSVLADTLSTERLDGAVDDLQSHRRHDEL